MIFCSLRRWNGKVGVEAPTGAFQELRRGMEIHFGAGHGAVPEVSR